MILRRNYMNSHFLHMREGETDSGHTVTIKLSEEVTFLNRGAIIKELAEIPDGAHVTIDASESFYIDHDVREVIEEFASSTERRKITLDLKWDKKTLEKMGKQLASAAS